MDSRKVSLFATIAVIALVAVGIGFAYTAATNNTGNNVTSEYIVALPSTDGSSAAYTGAITENIEYNTVNTGGTVTYSLTNPVSGEGQVGGYQLVDTFYVIVKPNGVTSAKDFKLTVAESTTSKIDHTDYLYKMVFGSGATKEAANTDAGIGNPTSIAEAHTVVFNGGGAIYNPATPMSTSGSDVIISITLFVKPDTELTSVGLPVGTQLPKAWDAAGLQFTIETL